MPEEPGRPPEISDEEIVAVFESSNDPVLSTAEVAENFSISHRGIRDRLTKLEKVGVIRSKKVGARAVVWWLSD